MLYFPNFLYSCVTCNVKNHFFHKEFIVENLKHAEKQKE